MKIVMPDKVSQTSLRMFQEHGFTVIQNPGLKIEECNALVQDADAVVVRSYNLRDLHLNDSLKAIGRAGVGVNNIPVDRCSEKGVVVFNTPGANANAVKELVLCGLFLSSRGIVEGVRWVLRQKDFGHEVPRSVEENKRQFRGEEIKGRTLGVIGLGAIGVLVANDAIALGMNVMGYDPYISVANAWMLSRDVKKTENLESIFKNSDYLTVHVPLNEDTRQMLNREAFAVVKRGVKILNFTRDEIVHTGDLIEALKEGRVGKYVTDFPGHDLIGVEGVIPMPHLGASTAEAEENCAVMITNQLVDFLKNGNITNSVNLPNCELERGGDTRITVINKNVPRMIEEITEVLAEKDLNIEEMINKSKGTIAYNILDISGAVNEEILEKIRAINGVVKARML